MQSLQKHKILIKREFDKAEEENRDISNLTFNQLKELGNQVKEKYLEMEGDKKEYYPKREGISRPISFGGVVSLIKNESKIRETKNNFKITDDRFSSMRGLSTSNMNHNNNHDNPEGKKWNAFIDKCKKKNSILLYNFIKKIHTINFFFLLLFHSLSKKKKFCFFIDKSKHKKKTYSIIFFLFYGKLLIIRLF